MEARAALEILNVAVDGKATDIVKKVEASESEDCVMNDSVKPKSEVKVKKEEITVSMSTVDEKSFVPLFEEIPCVAVCGKATGTDFVKKDELSESEDTVFE